MFMVKKEQRKYKNINYMIYFPKDYQEGKRYPVYFHLHGAGERGNDFSILEGLVPVSIIEKGDSPLSNAVCIIPQCPCGITWHDMLPLLYEFVEFIHSEPYCLTDHFVGSGISMGGYGLYQVMMARPHLFNKAIVCCGGGMSWNAGMLRDIKIKIFHGEDDKCVFVDESIHMYERLKEEGTDVSLTLYPNVGHNCWDLTYSNYDILKWALE